MSIYENLQSLEQLLNDCADPETGEIKEDDSVAYYALKKELSVDGLERLAKVRANKEARIEGLFLEINRLQEAREREIKAHEWIEKYMILIFNQSEKNRDNKVLAGTFTIGTRKSVSVEIDDNFNNEKYQTIVETKKTDKKLIKEDLQKGIEIAGARLIESQNLSVK